MKIVIAGLLIVSSTLAHAEAKNCAKHVQEVVTATAAGSSGVSVSMVQSIPGDDENSNHTYNVTVIASETQKMRGEDVITDFTENFKVIVSGDQKSCNILSLQKLQ